MKFSLIERQKRTHGDGKIKGIFFCIKLNYKLIIPKVVSKFGMFHTAYAIAFIKDITPTCFHLLGATVY